MLDKQLHLTKERILILIAIAGVFLFDQLSKYWILYGLNLPGCPDIGVNPRQCTEGRSIEILPFLDFTLVWNTGISFGLFKNDSWWGAFILSAISLIVAAFFLIWVWRIANSLASVAVGLIIGGAIGNVVDRWFYGAVVDFIDISDLKFYWVFNIADSAINVGVALLIWHLVFQSEEKSA